MAIKHAFFTEENKLTDGSVIWEVQTHGGEVIASFDTEEQADECAMDMNLALSDVCDKYPNATTCAD